jgi:threonine aldolase
MKAIDLRSDTVTRPSAGMREAMAAAEVGDDVYGEDPTVNLLQEQVAGLLGKEAALFVPSGSMGNQLCIKVHTRAGDEIIAERGAHVFNYETAGAAFLSSVQVHPVQGDRGILSPDRIQEVIRAKIYYMPVTRLICLENTHNGAGGVVTPIERIREIRALALKRGLRVHLDGARLWNASVASGVPVSAFAAEGDSVSVCLSKGLGAPVGSVIAGSREFIEEARHYRKLFGGGMRQAGILAAAGIYALEHNVERLAEDHVNARTFAERIAAAPGISVDLWTVQTNIVIFRWEGDGARFAQALRQRGVWIQDSGNGVFRAVTHLDVDRQEVLRAAEAVCEAAGM